MTEAPRYFRHAKSLELGVCVLVKQTPERRTYLFEDGVERTFREDFCQRFIEAAPAPAREVQIRLGRGVVSSR